MSDVKINGLNLVGSSNQPTSSTAADGRPAATVIRQIHGSGVEKPAVSGNAAQAGNDPRAELNEAVTRLNDYVQSIQRDLSFEFDESSGKTVITVLDRKTQEVIRQIPDEVALRLARNLQQDEPLSLFNMKA